MGTKGEIEMRIGWIVLLVLGVLCFMTGLALVIASSYINPVNPENCNLFPIGVCFGLPPLCVVMAISAIKSAENNGGYGGRWH